MGFHITQPGASVATSLIDGEAKPKHVLLLEIKVFIQNRSLFIHVECAFCSFSFLICFINREISIDQPKYL